MAKTIELRYVSPICADIHMPDSQGVPTDYRLTIETNRIKVRHRVSSRLLIWTRSPIALSLYGNDTVSASDPKRVMVESFMAEVHKRIALARVES